MSLNEFLEQAKSLQPISFNETIAVIMDNYSYTPSEFSNGLGDSPLINAAGTNEGSCKIFAFAKLQGLDAQQTLNLFGDFYRLDVFNDPDGSGHQNIRNFMRFGWEGIHFASPALQAK
ncbi:HopJ type III effector protein [Methylosoma difficile]